MEKFGSTAAGRAVSSGNSTWRTITGACRDEALHRCGSMWGHSLQQMPLDRARMVRMIQNGYCQRFYTWNMLAGLKFIQVPDCGDPGFGHRDSKPTTYICVDMSISTCRDDLSFPFCILFVLFALCTVFPLDLSNICQNLCILSA